MWKCREWKRQSSRWWQRMKRRYQIKLFFISLSKTPASLKYEKRLWKNICFKSNVIILCLLKYKIQNLKKNNNRSREVFVAFRAVSQRSYNVYYHTMPNQKAWLLFIFFKSKAISSACDQTHTPTQSCLYAFTSKPAKRLCAKYKMLDSRTSSTFSVGVWSECSHWVNASLQRAGVTIPK